MANTETEESRAVSNAKVEFIVIHETIFRGWARDASVFALFAGLIGLGVFADSAAMQWAGMIIAFIAILSKAQGKAKRMTRSEAISYLSGLEDAA